MRRLIWRLGGVLVMGGVLAGLCVGVLLTQRRAVEPQVFEVASGASASLIVRSLKERALVGEVWPLHLYLLAFGDRGMQAGEYMIEGPVSALELLALLQAGRVRQYPLTLVEGWTFDQVRKALDLAPALEHRLPGLDDAALMTSLGAPGLAPEGQFFPDTYLYVRGESDLDVLRRAYRRMQTVLAEEWQVRRVELPLGGSQDALVLASIIEKETGHPDDREGIAAVFLRRLDEGMRLQSDPTVIYGLRQVDPDAYEGDLMRSHLRRSTPWNTYRRDGLPPTPIAMPGLASIRAALRARPGDALYFVARGDGRSHFSANLDEHNRAVRRYQLGIADSCAGDDGEHPCP